MQELSKVYLDFNATSPVSVRVREALVAEISNWGNPSSIHWAGRMIKSKLREARRQIAMQLGAGPLELIFTSGASESNNTLVFGIAALAREKNSDHQLPAIFAGRDEFITSQVEHPSLAKAFDELESRGFTVHRIPVSRTGAFDLEAYRAKLSEKTLLVSVMMANNETGNIMPVPEIVRLAKEAGALTHTDATQALGKMRFRLNELGVDYASLSAHKFHALKGTGVLFVKKGSPFKNLIFGAQERSRRGGTENTLGQIAFAAALEDLGALEAQILKMTALRDGLENRILTEIPNVSRTGSCSPRLPNTSSLVLKGVDGETLLMSLDLRGFAVSTGAACSSGSPEPSPVLLGMGLTRQEAQNSLRISIGWSTTAEELDAFVNHLKEIVLHLRSINEEEARRHGSPDGTLKAEA